MTETSVSFRSSYQDIPPCNKKDRKTNLEWIFFFCTARMLGFSKKLKDVSIIKCVKKKIGGRLGVFLFGVSSICVKEIFPHMHRYTFSHTFIHGDILTDP